MFDKTNFKQLITGVLILGLFFLAAMIIKPIIISIISGILLAYILYPLYNWLLRKLKNENLSALIICLGLLIIIFGMISLILTSLLNQAVNIYSALQNIDLANVLERALPKFLTTEISSTIGGSLNTFISKLFSNLLDATGEFILNIPIFLLQLFVAIFIFFFALKDGKKAIEYIKSLNLLEKETQEKLFKQFKDITYSVLMGQIVVGIIQGLIAGIGYFIFGVPNALILTLLTMIIGVIPLIGPWLVWIPVVIYLFATGHSGAGLGLLIYGLVIISWLDAFIRPLIVSKKTRINSAIVIIGMVGGLFVFGILGLIIGPLVLAYVLLIIELYRKRTPTDKNIIFKEV
jgi:predicted PurR-regulated permease PerM